MNYYIAIVLRLIRGDLYGYAGNTFLGQTTLLTVMPFLVNLSLFILSSLSVSEEDQGLVCTTMTSVLR